VNTDQPSGPSRLRSALLTGLGILTAVVLVAVAARGSTSAGRDGIRRPAETLMDILFSLYILMMVAGGVLFLYALYVARYRLGESRERRRGWWGFLGPVLLVLGAMLLARHVANNEIRLPETLVSPPPAGDVTTPTGTTGETYEAEFAWIPVLVTLALIGVAVFGMWWSGRARRRARGERQRNPLSEAIAAAVDESLDDLRAEPDPRRAVIAAYARLELVLAAHGLPRSPSEAPLEYLRRMLTELSVSPAAAQRLTDLFERAKFSQHAVGPEMKEQAIEALETVRDDLLAARARAELERAEALAAMARKPAAG
jgi:Domain of unknown function (DUF4129)